MTASSLTGNAILYTWDALGRNLTQLTSKGQLSSSWDAAGRRTRLDYGGVFHVDYEYDLAGAMTAVRENGATSGAGVLATYGYDDSGRRTSLTRGNGTGTNYSYDAVSRLSGLTQNLNGTGSDVTFAYAYNPAGEIVSSTRDNDAYAYTGHANANIVSIVNGLNQVTNVGGSTVSHGDGRGNVTAIGSASYSYTPENRLSHGPNGSAYSYDALGRLYFGGTAAANSYLQADGDRIVGEIAPSGGPFQRRYVYGADLDEPLVWYEGAGTSDRRWLHADERGSVIAVSDGSGNLSGSVNRYDEYGNVQGTLNGRFGYTGQAWMPDAGLWYYRSRMYNPTLPRFMQTDPIGMDGGMNLYAYVGNNPVNFVDPMGLTWRRVCIDQYDADGHIVGQTCGWRNDEDGNDVPFWPQDPGVPNSANPLSVHLTPERMAQIGAVPTASPACTSAQRIGQAAGRGLSRLGGDVMWTGVGITILGGFVVFLGIISENPIVVIAGVHIAQRGGTVTVAGGGISLAGAGTQAVSGRLNDAVSSAAGSAASALPTSPASQAIASNIIENSVSKNLQDLNLCEP